MVKKSPYNATNSSSVQNEDISSPFMFNVPAILCIYFFEFFLSTVGNTVVCWIVKRNLSMHNSINYLLVNLALADLLMTFSSLSLILADTAIDVDRGNLNCKVQGASFQVFHRASMMTLIAIGHNRYEAICKPLATMRQQYPIKSVVGLIWSFSCISHSPLFIYCGSLVYADNITICACLETFPTSKGRLVYTIYMILVDYVVSGIVIVLFYVAIILKLRLPPPGQSRACPAYQARRGVIKMLLISFIGFFVSWTPIYVIHFLDAVDIDLRNVDKFIRYPSLLLGFCNAAFNPIIYYFLSENFREGFKTALCCHRRRHFPQISAQ